MRARMALLASGQRCELREVVLRDKPAELLAASPKGTVPVLVLADGAVIDQSLAIMRWALQQNDPMGWLEPGLDSMLALVEMCDGGFKHHLDRYKYPQRYTDTDVYTHQNHAGGFISRLEEQLGVSGYLFGDHVALADFAIAPFVRQYAQVDAKWFAAQPWPQVQAWLVRLLGSTVWMSAMKKYPQWVSDTQGCLLQAE